MGNDTGKVDVNKEHTRDGLVKILHDFRDAPISGEELGEKLGVSRAAVNSHINQLREMGYVIDAATKTGYRLVSVPDRLLPVELRVRLDDLGAADACIGCEIHYFPKLESTNDTAKAIAPDVHDGTVVIAEMQTKGRGRLGRAWMSPEGGIWLSVVLKPKIAPQDAAKLTLMAGIAVAYTMREFDIPAEIKWPNDILVNGKKVCGILTEMSSEADVMEYAVLGIGIDANVDTQKFPLEAKVSATSMQAELGHPVDRLEFTAKLLIRLNEEYARFEKAFVDGEIRAFDAMLDEWKSLSDTIGRVVTIQMRTKIISGEAAGIDHNGALIVETDGGIERVFAGDCVYTR